jgi:hypothetical protein
VKGVMARRDKIVATFQTLIAQKVERKSSISLEERRKVSRGPCHIISNFLKENLPGAEGFEN